jgi:hypothetical protein
LEPAPVTLTAIEFDRFAGLGRPRRVLYLRQRRSGAWIAGRDRRRARTPTHFGLQRTIGTSLPDIDFCALARGQGVKAISVNRREALEDTLRSAFATTALRSPFAKGRSLQRNGTPKRRREAVAVPGHETVKPSWETALLLENGSGSVLDRKVRIHLAPAESHQQTRFGELQWVVRFLEHRIGDTRILR